jgi:hypothetical protein
VVRFLPFMDHRQIAEPRNRARSTFTFPHPDYTNRDFSADDGSINKEINSFETTLGIREEEGDLEEEGLPYPEPNRKLLLRRVPGKEILRTDLA